MTEDMNHLFAVVPHGELDTGSSELRPLSRQAAEELLVLACLRPIAASKLAAPFSEVVYASDASTLTRGLVATAVTPDMARAVWRTARKTARNPRFRSCTAALHRLHDEFFEERRMTALSGRVSGLGHWAANWVTLSLLLCPSWILMPHLDFLARAISPP